MSALIKTQCPFCYAYFDLPTALTELLHHPHTQIRCTHCQKSFIISENLTVSADNVAPAHNIKHSAEEGLNNSWLEALVYNYNDSDSSDYITTDVDDDLQGLLTSAGAGANDSQTSPSHSPNPSILSASRLQPKRVTAQQQSLSIAEEGPRSIANLLWVAGCLVLVLSLFAQYVIFNLNTLLKNPYYAERLEVVCAIAACRLPSATIEAFIIDDISFDASKIQRGNEFIDLQATLANKSMQTQLLPNLKVSLYNSGSLIGEFIALPEEYSTGRQSQLAAGYTMSFMFTIPLSVTQVSHVDVEPFY